MSNNRAASPEEASDAFTGGWVKLHHIRIIHVSPSICLVSMEMNAYSCARSREKKERGSTGEESPASSVKLKATLIVQELSPGDYVIFKTHCAQVIWPTRRSGRTGAFDSVSLRGFNGQVSALWFLSAVVH